MEKKTAETVQNFPLEIFYRKKQKIKKIRRCSLEDFILNISVNGNVRFFLEICSDIASSPLQLIKLIM